MVVDARFKLTYWVSTTIFSKNCYFRLLKALKTGFF